MSQIARTESGNRFGTFGGVFTPCVLTILGVIMFLRFGFVVGQAGVWAALLIVLASKVITLLTTLSLSAIATNTRVEGGGAYFLISRSAGPGVWRRDWDLVLCRSSTFGRHVRDRIQRSVGGLLAGRNFAHHHRLDHESVGLSLCRDRCQLGDQDPVFHSGHRHRFRYSAFTLVLGNHLTRRCWRPTVPRVSPQVSPFGRCSRCSSRR